MSGKEFENLVGAFRDVVRPHLERSESARAFASALGEWLIAEARRASATPQESAPVAPVEAERSPATPPSADTGVPDRSSPTPPARKTTSGGIVPLKIGDATVHLAVQGATEDLGRARQAAAASEASDSERDGFGGATQELSLSLIATRSRLKAASCLLAIDRRAAVGDGDRERPILAKMETMIGEAKAMRDCFLWAFWRERPAPPDPSLRVIARCYDALAEAAELVERLDGMGERVPRDDVAAAMQHLAAASSALRIGLQDTWMTSPDVDQEESHLWLRQESFTRRIYIPRFMSLSDAADPRDAEAIIGEIGELRRHVDARVASRSAIDQGFKRIEYHAKRIASSPGAPSEHDLQKIADTIDDHASRGVRDSDTRYADALPPEVAALLLEHDVEAARAVAQRVMDRARPGAESDRSEDKTRAWSERVASVRPLLEGRRIVVIGGEARPEAIARITDAFHAGEVEWVRLTEHGTGDPMRAPIQRADTALVVLIVKLAGHLHLEEARAYAGQAGKPFVLLTGGYNPEQIAEAVLQQASARLQAAT